MIFSEKKQRLDKQILSWTHSKFIGKDSHQGKIIFFLQQLASTLCTTLGGEQQISDVKRTCEIIFGNENQYSFMLDIPLPNCSQNTASPSCPLS